MRRVEPAVGRVAARCAGGLAVAIWAAVGGVHAGGPTAQAVAAGWSLRALGDVAGTGPYAVVRYPSWGRVAGALIDGVPGTAVVLEEDPFPYRGGFSKLGGSETGHGGVFAFKVRPVLATRYRVALASDPGVVSGTVALYTAVTWSRWHTTWSPGCLEPAPTSCVASMKIAETVPPPAIKAELSGPWYEYVGVDLVAGEHRHPSKPRPLVLGPSGNVRGIEVSRDRIVWRTTEQFVVSSEYVPTGWSVNAVVDVCTPDVPGGLEWPSVVEKLHRRCGAPTFPDVLGDPSTSALHGVAPGSRSLGVARGRLPAASASGAASLRLTVRARGSACGRRATCRQARRRWVLALPVAVRGRAWC